MKCARLQLQERAKPVVKKRPPSEKPRRYCQKRMINPEHSEDPRWADATHRFHCNTPIHIEEEFHTEIDAPTPRQNYEDLFLTVQNIQFQGDIKNMKRPKTSFKYKSLTGDKQHRMFVKQVVEDDSNQIDDSVSQLSSYYFDDYVKYILSTDRSDSRPSTGKSSVFLQSLSNKFVEKSTQADNKNEREVKKPRKTEKKKDTTVKIVKCDVEKVEKNNLEDNSGIADAKVAYHKSGKRKSLTISRVPSPETVQVIRVDVVRNYSTSSNISDNEEKKSQLDDLTKLTDENLEKISLKGSHFTDKYLLTNTIKSVDEKLSCGSKVTLLCKTFKLSNRNKCAERKYTKTVKDTSKSKKQSLTAK